VKFKHTKRLIAFSYVKERSNNEFSNCKSKTDINVCGKVISTVYNTIPGPQKYRRPLLWLESIIYVHYEHITFGFFKNTPSYVCLSLVVFDLNWKLSSYLHNNLSNRDNNPGKEADNGITR